MKTLKQILVISLCLFMALNVFAQENPSLENQPPKNPQAQDPDSRDPNTIFGKVISIDDDSITIEKIEIIEQKTEETFSVTDKVKVFETIMPLPPQDRDNRPRRNDNKGPRDMQGNPHRDGNSQEKNPPKKNQQKPVEKRVKANYSDIAPGAMVKIETDKTGKTIKNIFIKTNPFKEGDLSSPENSSIDINQ